MRFFIPANCNLLVIKGYVLSGICAITNLVFHHGFGSDQVFPARMVTAKGELLQINEETHPELLWALRGAGQFFGLVTQLVIKAYPVSLLGSMDGTI